MIDITVVIEGMTCGMCEVHINEAVRDVFQVKYNFGEKCTG